MNNFLEGICRSEFYAEDTPSSTSGRRIKRERDRHANTDDDDEVAYSSNHAAKRQRRHGPDLITFEKPFPCAFRHRCRFRLTCSYHHGDPTPCNCNDAHCPRGHAHRRAPKPCDHGSTTMCRWNMLKECSFHHGDARTCYCDDAACRRAHPRRVRRNAEARDAKKKQDPDHQKRVERYMRQLYVGLPPRSQLSVSEIHKWFSDCIRAGCVNSSVPFTEDPILGVQIDQEQRFAFVELKSAAVTTACLALDGVSILGRGRVDVQRPKSYDPSVHSTPLDSSNIPVEPNIVLDKSKLGHYITPPTKNKVPKKEKKKSKKVEHYRTWKKEQKALKQGQTNEELRKRYLELFPDVI